MEEKFLVRVDEERPSDDRLEVRFVEAHEMSSEYKQRIDALINKLDKLTTVSGNAEILRDIKEILANLSNSLKALDGKYRDLSLKSNNPDVLEGIEDLKTLIAGREDLDVILNELGKVKVLASNREGFEAVLDEVEKLRSDVETLSTAIVATDRKYYEINDNIQDIKDKINKRDDNEEVKGLLSDLAIYVDSLAQKFDTVAQKASESETDRDILENHIVSQLESLKGNGLSDESIKELTAKLESVKRSVTNAVNRANRSQLKVDKTVKDFNSYLSRLNSIDYMLRLLAAKNLLKSRKKLPKWAKEKKKVLEKLILGLEDEVADILIVNAVTKNGVTVVDMSKAIGRTRKKTMERVAQLIAGGFVEERKVGRKKLYFLIG